MPQAAPDFTAFSFHRQPDAEFAGLLSHGVWLPPCGLCLQSEGQPLTFTMSLASRRVPDSLGEARD